MAQITKIRYFQLCIPFTTLFKHGSAERAQTETVIVEVTDIGGLVGYGEGCPRSYVTGESIASCQEFFKDNNHSFEKISNLDELKAYVQNQQSLIDDNPAAWCAVELAILDLLAKEKGVPVETFLELEAPRARYRYSAVLGDSSPTSFAGLYKQYRAMEFRDYKIKLSDDISKEQAKLGCLINDLSDITLRADANNLWATKGEALEYLNTLEVKFQALEEPITSNQYEDLSILAEELSLKVILDESFMRYGQVILLEENPSSWIVNIRVSKMGGILRSLKIIDALKQLDIDITIGAQVGETSLLSRAALMLADQAGGNLNTQEGAFGTLLLERDLFEPILQFGKGGLLTDNSGYRDEPGFGLDLVCALDSCAETTLLL